jgi:hypothetical protein
LSSYLLSKDLKIKTYKTVILPVESWSLIPREVHMWRVFYNRMLLRLFGLKMEVVAEDVF